MSLTPGTRLGPYEIVAPLGAGGMGEVYRARDPRLEREVAIKVLPTEVSASEEVRQRFEREARTVSKLGHPNICAVFDVGREGEIEYLVMELLEGETLASRLARGRLPVDQVVRHAAEIASALGAAHARGIVHRDLKPANIMLTRTGIKLLDFGLAKTFAKPSDGSVSHTLTATLGLTGDGMLLGTVPYMAPEQIEGGPVDAKTDIFAFGAVLFELATGVRAFGGKSQAAVMTAILTHDPPALSTIAPSVPGPLDALVRRCLARDPALRWSSAADLELQLREISQTLSGGTAPTRPVRRLRTLWIPWAVAAIAVVASAVTFALARHPAVSAAVPVRFQFSTPPGTSFAGVFESPFLAVSPDGSQIAFLATAEAGRPMIWLRPLAALQARPLAGTEGARMVFWAPDGQSLGFVAAGKLQRLALAGGAPIPICALPDDAGISASWGSAGEILFASILGHTLNAVPASGGVPTPRVVADTVKGEMRAVWPCYLPDGKHFVYLLTRLDGSGSIMFAAPGAPPRPLLDAASSMAFTDPDLLVYVREGALLGQRFDWRSGKLLGGPFSVVDTVRYFMSTGGAAFATSAGGTLVYGSSDDVERLVWLDRSGRELGTVSSPGDYLDVNLAKDGGRLLFSRALPRIGTLDVWSYDLARGTETRLTHGLNSEFAGFFLPGGRGIAYSAVDRGLPRLHRQDLDTENSTIMLPPTGFQWATDLSPDNRTLAYTERTPAGESTVWTLSLETGAAPVRLLPHDASAGGARFSPDGRYMAFLSEESGHSEAYVVPFPDPGERVRVSTGGAVAVRWPRAANEILYQSADRRIVSVPVRTRPTLQLGAPVVLFTLAEDAVWPDFDVTADGKRILAIVPRVDASRLPLTVVAHWPQAAAK